MAAPKLFRAKCAPNSKNDSIDDSEMDNRLKKIYILLTLGRMTSRLQVFLLPVNFELNRRTSHKHGMAAKNSF